MITRKTIESELDAAKFQKAQEWRRSVTSGYEVRDNGNGLAFVSYYRGSDLQMSEDDQYVKIGIIENFLSKKYDVKRRTERGITTLYVTEKQYDRTQRLLSNVVANLPIIKGENEAVFVATALRHVANKLAPESAKDDSGIEFVDKMEGWIDRVSQDNSGEYDGNS